MELDYPNGVCFSHFSSQVWKLIVMLQKFMIHKKQNSLEQKGSQYHSYSNLSL